MHMSVAFELLLLVSDVLQYGNGSEGIFKSYLFGVNLGQDLRAWCKIL